MLGVPGLRGTRLTRREVLILQFCRRAALDANAITDEHVAELKAEGRTDAEIVEMIETMNFTTGTRKSSTPSPSSLTRGSSDVPRSSHSKRSAPSILRAVEAVPVRLAPLHHQVNPLCITEDPDVVERIPVDDHDIGQPAGLETLHARDRLAAITGPGPASFVYDGTGRRRAKTIDGGRYSKVLQALGASVARQGGARRQADGYRWTS